MEFPRFVFMSPGDTRIPEGSYKAELVNSQEEFLAALSAGYSETVLRAIKAANAPKAETEPAPSVERKPSIEVVRVQPDLEPAAPEPEPEVEQPRKPSRPPKRR